MAKICKMGLATGTDLKTAAQVRYLPCRGSAAAIMFFASNICWINSAKKEKVRNRERHTNSQMDHHIDGQRDGYTDRHIDRYEDNYNKQTAILMLAPGTVSDR